MHCPRLCCILHVGAGVTLAPLTSRCLVSLDEATDPHGFAEFDGSLEVLPGSHRVEPEKYKALLADNGIHSMGDAIEKAANQRPHLPDAVSAEFGLRPLTFSALPGSLVFLNARCYHGVAAQLPDSPLAHRLFCNMIFKEGDGSPSGGPPHRFTQPIPKAWLEGEVSDHRRQLFGRVPYSDDTENEELPNAWALWEPPSPHVKAEEIRERDDHPRDFTSWSSYDVHHVGSARAVRDTAAAGRQSTRRWKKAPVVKGLQAFLNRLGADPSSQRRPINYVTWTPIPHG